MTKPVPHPDRDDLVAAALAVQDQIRAAYRNHEEHRPVMLYDLEQVRLYALPYADYRESRTERLVSFLLDRE